MNMTKRIAGINSSIFFVLVLLVALGLSTAGCGRRRKQDVKEEIPVKVIRLELKNVKKSLDYVDNIEAQDDAKIYPKVGGKVIEKIKEEGSVVKKGDVILYVDRDEIGFTFEKAPVETPMDGMVGRVYVDIGTNVTPQTAVALVIDIDKVEIKLDIPGKYIPLVSLDQSAEIMIDAYPGKIFRGKVTKISPVLDLETRTAPIEITVPNENRQLKPGMFARVSLILEQHKQVPVILKESFMGKPPQCYVFVVEEGIARKREVTLGIREGAYFEVLDGLKEGDAVVIMGQQRLRDGMAVCMEEEDREDRI